MTDLTGSVVYGVHITRERASVTGGHVGAITTMWATEAEARAEARSQAGHTGVRYASVSSWIVGELGTRTTVCWYQLSSEGTVEVDRNGRPFPTDGRVSLHPYGTERH